MILGLDRGAAVPVPGGTRPDDDRLREECGVFGVFGNKEAAALTALGLHSLQHRGQEAAGIVTFEDGHFHSERRLGLVGDNFNKADVIARLKGNMALGHNRYSTTGDVVLRNVQPLFADFDTEAGLIKAAFERPDNPSRVMLMGIGGRTPGVAATWLDDVRKRYAGDKVRVDRRIKLFADGAFFAQNMQMNAPGYSDGHEGKWLIEPPVFNALAASGLQAGRLELEITEKVLLQNREEAFTTLTRLHDLGVRIALDDFGTGYSSLSNLRKFPFDKIKIDRSFVSDLSEANVDALAVVRSVTRLGVSLGMATTAEGVETSDQADRVRAEGCTEMQGYFICPPSSAKEIARLFPEQIHKPASAA